MLSRHPLYKELKKVGNFKKSVWVKNKDEQFFRDGY
jgi:hypothetical protein